VWGLGAVCHYAYLGAQYTIGQGVVSMRARAAAIAILLLIVALIGNGVGPQFLGIMSDTFMGMQIQSLDATGTLTHAQCLVEVTGKGDPAAPMAAESLAVCKAAYGEGVRQAMSLQTLFFIPAAALFFLASRTLKKDMVAKPV
jgi:hypothetical protein